MKPTQPRDSDGCTHTVKVRDDLVEEAQTLNPPIVDALLRVEIREVGDGGEHHTDLIVGLAVQLLEHIGVDSIDTTFLPVCI